MAKERRSLEEWQRIIEAQQTSGQTQRDWCWTNGINLYTFQDRASRLRRSGYRMKEIDVEQQPVDEKTSEESQISESKMAWVQIEQTLSCSPVAAAQNSKLIIEYGELRLTADSDYPIPALAALLRELAKSETAVKSC
jgi:hypothetical protein